MHAHAYCYVSPHPHTQTNNIAPTKCNKISLSLIFAHWHSDTYTTKFSQCVSPAVLSYRVLNFFSYAVVVFGWNETRTTIWFIKPDFMWQIGVCVLCVAIATVVFFAWLLLFVCLNLVRTHIMWVWHGAFLVIALCESESLSLSRSPNGCNYRFRSHIHSHSKCSINCECYSIHFSPDEGKENNTNTQTNLLHKQ